MCHFLYLVGTMKRYALSTHGLFSKLYSLLVCLLGPPGWEYVSWQVKQISTYEEKISPTNLLPCLVFVAFVLQYCLVLRVCFLCFVIIAFL